MDELDLFHSSALKDIHSVSKQKSEVLKDKPYTKWLLFGNSRAKVSTKQIKSQSTDKTRQR